MLNGFRAPTRLAVASLIVAVCLGVFSVACGPAEAGENPIVVMETSMGDIVIELDADKAPVSTDNFMTYVDEKFYNGLIFHRVISNFMIQGGGFTKDMVKKSGHPEIENEANNGLSNKRGTIAMARTSAINSATSQFFINVKDNASLDYRGPNQFGYAVFGHVIEGMDVVDEIRSVQTATKNGMGDVPTTAVVIYKAYRKDVKKGAKTDKKEGS